MEPGESRRARARRDKRQRIAQAAAELFREQGFEATTTDQIAERADVAKGTIFRYAPTKARLLVLVFETNLEAAVAEAFAALDDTLPCTAVLLAIFRHIFRVYEQDPDLGRRFVQEALFLTSADPPYSSALDDFAARLVVLLAGWQAQGRLAAGVDARLLAQTTLAIYFSALVAWLGGRLPDPVVRDRMLAAGLAWHLRETLQ
jgi:AcrR family transcriptional regulator